MKVVEAMEAMEAMGAMGAILVVVFHARPSSAYCASYLLSSSLWTESWKALETVWTRQRVGCIH